MSKNVNEARRKIEEAVYDLLSDEIEDVVDDLGDAFNLSKLGCAFLSQELNNIGEDIAEKAMSELEEGIYTIEWIMGEIHEELYQQGSALVCSFSFDESVYLYGLPSYMERGDLDD